jgi:hypothetical protein
MLSLCAFLQFIKTPYVFDAHYTRHKHLNIPRSAPNSVSDSVNLRIYVFAEFNTIMNAVYFKK